MPAIVRMERPPRVCKVRVIVLCVLVGLWSFISLSGAEVTETFWALRGLMIGVTMAAPEAAGGIVVAMLADDILTIAVTPDLGSAMLTAVSSMDTAAPLPGILVAG
jgi:hypothetical protein